MDRLVVLPQDMSHLRCGARQHLAAQQLTGRLSKARNLGSLSLLPFDHFFPQCFIRMTSLSEVIEIVILQYSSWQRLDLDAIEAGDAVRFGPKRDFSSIRESAIRRSEQLFAVEGDGEAFAFGFKAKRVPLIA